MFFVIVESTRLSLFLTEIDLVLQGRPLVDRYELPQCVTLLSSWTERVVREEEAMKRQKPGNIHSVKVLY